MTDDLSGRTAFADALARLRTSRGLNKKTLARMMGFDPSYVSHVENGRHRPTLEFAARADAVLQTNGELAAAFDAFLTETQTQDGPSPRTTRAAARSRAGLVVRREDSRRPRPGDGTSAIRSLPTVPTPAAHPG